MAEDRTRPFLINFRGHNQRPTRFISSDKIGGYYGKHVSNAVSSMRLGEELERRFSEVGERLKDDGLLANAKTVGKGYEQLFGYLGGCGVCGETLRLKKVADDKFAVDSKCKYPKGIKPFDLKLKVPSGKIVFTNDSRELVDVQDDFECNAVLGTVKTCKAYEKAGMVHFLVGNSCPGIFKMPGGRLRVATSGHSGGGRRVGSVTTDLWWVCAMDNDLFGKLSKEKGVERDERHETIVPVKKGTWAFKFDPNFGCEFKFAAARLVK